MTDDITRERKRGFEAQLHREEGHVKTLARTCAVQRSQGMSKIASPHQNLGEKHGMDSLSESSEGTNPINTD